MRLRALLVECFPFCKGEWDPAWSWLRDERGVIERAEKEATRSSSKGKPPRLAVLVEASHMCMVIRGVEKSASTTATTCFRGSFKDSVEERAQFFQMLGGSRR